MLRELRNSVRLLLILCELGEMLQAVLRGDAPAQGRPGELARELAEVAYEHRELWMRRNRPGGLEEMSMKPFYAWQEELRRM